MYAIKKGTSDVRFYYFFTGLCKQHCKKHIFCIQSFYIDRKP